jgi:hypothetical protein
MVADMTAHGFAMQNREIKAGAKTDWKDRKKMTEVNQGQTGWTILEATPEYLSALIDQFNDQQSSKLEDYLKRKAAWVASQKKE